MSTNVIETRNLCKVFPRTLALQDVNFELKKGEIMGLLGKNGAGKSTLIKLLAGLERKSKGDILFFGKKVDINGVEYSENLHFRFVSQEPELLNELSIAENIAFRERYFKTARFVDWVHIYEAAEEKIRVSGFPLDCRKEVRFLTIAERQMLLAVREILSTDAEIIALDEIATSLSVKEKQILYKLMRDQVKKGKTFIYISHEIDEIFEICDSVTVLRDGKITLVDEVRNLTPKDLRTAIVGKEIGKVAGGKSEGLEGRAKEKILILEHVTNRQLRDVSFDLCKGEVLGVYGLRGSGRTELLKSIFGLMHVDSGRIFYKERRLENRKSEETLRRGVGFVPEERDQGIFYNRPVSENLSISTLEKLVKRLFISLRKERQIFDDIKGKLGLSVPSAETEAYYLSGGNKQKVMLGRILAAGCDVYLLDEPTKGIDVGVKSEFYRLMRNLASEGNAIIFSSSDLEEIIEVCDRAVVLYKGCIVKVLQKQELTKMGLVSYADGKADESGIGG